ncbi:hypothetical protein [Rubellimicrobium roseum]|uniref:Uncharacterized protein n=1 Tax=Rubellimicrobium roseum TaxID=687525 RepID=A0A5C4NHN7_9RHOB|nr:hypothetical protein [Rubellimicrobium roseum]TNC71949.1 hypothetical protein FHG71_09410 [Rubellimicrobium roseum]
MTGAPAEMILVIGNLDAWERHGRRAPDLDGFRFARFDEIDAGLLAEVAPGMVLSWLVDDGHDAVDIARRLAELGFAGRYRALAPDLPNVAAIVEEVREVAPDLDFDLFRVSPGI